MKAKKPGRKNNLSFNKMVEKINLKLDNNFYTREAIEASLEDFSEVCEGHIISNEFEIELVPKLENLDKLKEKFSNYVFALMKNMGDVPDSRPVCKSNEKKRAKSVENFIRIRKIGDKYLLVSDSGSWTSLSESEYKIYSKGSYKDNLKLYKRLKENYLLLDKNNITDCIEFTRKKKDFLFQGTSLHIIVLTKRCNLDCAYCQASAKNEDEEKYNLDIATAKKIVDVIFQTPSEAITIEFQGGEPLMNFETLKFVVDYARDKNITYKKSLRFSVVSNLTLMTDEVLEFLMDNEIPLCTSLDGPKEVHNACRSGYSTVSKWIKKTQEFHKQGRYPHKLNALLTATKHSLEKSKEIVDTYIEHGFKRIFLRPMNNLGYAEKNQDIAPTADEFIDFWKKSLNYILELNYNGTSFIEWKTYLILRKLFERTDPNFAELRSPCGAVIGQLVYNYDGNIYTCDEGRMIDDDVFKLGTADQSYEELTTNTCACNVISASINDTLYCDKCVYKPFCGVCPVLNYVNTGSVITNIPSTDWCKIHKAQFDYVFKKLNEDKKAKEVFDKWLNYEKPKNVVGFHE
ncbi:MAG: His-Xaa-Ser system radical SAM maturase HxsB [Nanobdellota archaeon]